jgi:hypothetical protein
VVPPYDLQVLSSHEIRDAVCVAAAIGVALHQQGTLQSNRIVLLAGQLLTTLCHHSDYVTCLAAAQQRPLVASGGLRGEVFLIDVAVRG